ncbi:alpha/beta hydrolase [Nocardia donostiensis]|uniref:DUF1023 domain-containing protein n=1 Tax=Nocardia donostiensis TaxID=1538463 RepID=A0A1V2TAL9_9NOCA|nr:alpha/beta hydrolase [Nocardia donostiensis]ONM46401.1 hypothetical protein B0T46_23145 [Nocardia donostiensis]OQS16308.1 hypothetical protein B0T36_05975 [Nocardia donostiensis]OQS18291.1 hypothetical protein B0T44_20390 [Nocardia donostiensis]
MRGARPDPGDSYLEENHPAIFSARLLAQRLERIILEMGEGVSEAVYRRTRDAVVRGNYDFILADQDNARVFEALQRVQPFVAASGPARPDIGLPHDPRQLREVWEDLSEADREELFRLDPFLGNRNGIPHADRDLFNRRNLDEISRQARESEDFHRSMSYSELSRMLDAQQTGEPRIYLSHFDDNGRVAFSLDDPDFADNTAVLLEPAGREGDALQYAISTSQQLRQLALLTSPGDRTAVSFWGVYRQPQSFVETIFPQFAQDGVAGVREYHTGLRATHDGSSGHITTVGHSYASVLAGHSAGGGATLDTDDIVFIGSWGTGVNNAGELSLGGVAPGNTAEHVFSTMASGDHVQLMPDTHGPLPTDPEYGARTLESSSVIPDRWNSFDHSADFYLASTNPAAQNIGLVITGRGDLVS